MTADKRADILSLARKTIHTEALALKHLEQTLGDDFVCAVELILHSRGKLVVTGMGKSGLIGRKIAATLASTGTPSFFLHPGEAFHGDLGMISPEDTVLALSYSGETDEILKIVPFIHTNGNKLISMTGNPESTLARNSDVHLDVAVRHEALHPAPGAYHFDYGTDCHGRRDGRSADEAAQFHEHRLRAAASGRQPGPPSADDCRQCDAQGGVARGSSGLFGQGYDPRRQQRRSGADRHLRGGQSAGIVTDGDIRRAMERRESEFFSIRAMDIATPNPKTIGPDEKLIAAEKKMTQHKINSLLVTDDQGKLVGVIQIYDIKL